MESELYAARAAHRAGPIITGHVVRLAEGYARELRVGQHVLVAVLFAAGIARLLGLALAALRQAGGAGGARRRWRELRKGPEFLVTPLQLRDTRGVLCEVEIHGHLPQSALDPGDHIQVTVRRQKDHQLPPRADRIVNITTGQLLTPRIPTLWSHLGPALLLQAVLGVVLLAVAAWLLTR
ncbi:hypothetical protein SAMN05444365_1187 [Micromonospora pattaloongensis]|uniref:Uncharacterized protein n=1 Tax=Micromonospora pattaloongensis TaxID=405436 RepID=A0A1H3T565_9ACTN|nr:hypothetical protein [Micromonospora pattaloongensis]SDZ45180.1 hypothetical protein SAMN05444365_1187 [Micromonospora pattaloongensis]